MLRILTPPEQVPVRDYKHLINTIVRYIQCFRTPFNYDLDVVGSKYYENVIHFAIIENKNQCKRTNVYMLNDLKKKKKKACDKII